MGTPKQSSSNILKLPLKCEIKVNADGVIHGCQNRDLDHRIAQFYDPTSPKRLESH